NAIRRPCTSPFVPTLYPSTLRACDRRSRAPRSAWRNRVVAVALATVAVRASARGPRVLAEYQGLDGDGNGLRRHTNAPQVDVVEIPEDDTVDDEHVAVHAHFVAEDGAERLRDVPVDHDVQGHALRQGLRQSVTDTLGKSGDALVGRDSLPAQCERSLAFALDEIECLEVLADRIRELLGIDAL